MAKKILLVDDEQDVLKVVAIRLKKAGYELYFGNNGQEGLDLARQHKPDLIVLDYHMPVLNGLEVCQALRQEEEFKAIPIIFMTASSVGQQREELTKYIGIENVVQKPFEANEFIEKVTRLIGPGN